MRLFIATDSISARNNPQRLRCTRLNSSQRKIRLGRCLRYIGGNQSQRIVEIRETRRKMENRGEAGEFDWLKASFFPPSWEGSFFGWEEKLTWMQLAVSTLQEPLSEKRLHRSIYGWKSIHHAPLWPEKFSVGTWWPIIECASSRGNQSDATLRWTFIRAKIALAFTDHTAFAGAFESVGCRNTSWRKCSDRTCTIIAFLRFPVKRTILSSFRLVVVSKIQPRAD